jgi:hypothetical protein
VKKKVAATRIITAAAEPSIDVVEFDFAGCSRWDDGDLTLAAGTGGTA